MSTRVFLVGAGPGALDLVTMKARALIGAAEVLVYDHLCNAEMLRWAREGAEKIYAGKESSAHTLTQEEINALLVEKARAGKVVVRRGAIPMSSGAAGRRRRRWRARGWRSRRCRG